MNYVGIVNTPKLESAHIAKIKVPSGGLYAGQVVYCEELDSTITNNFEVYLATKPVTSNFASKNLAIVLNGGFETMSDGRRPEGQPDFTQYSYAEGEIATVAFIDRHLRFSISGDSIDSDTIGDIAIGKYLIPLDDSNSLAVATSVPDAITTALKVVAIRNMPVGGDFGLGYATTYICVTQKDDIVDSGNFIKTFSVPNQVGTSVINNTSGTISLVVAGSLTSIAATFTNSKDSVVTIGGVTQVSGITTNTFTSPVTYVVTSEGGIAKNYVVTASLAEYELTTSVDENTTLVVTREGTPITSADELVYGDVLTISTTYATGSEKDALTLNGAAFTSGETHTVVGDVAIVASSKYIEYTLATTADEHTTLTITRNGTPITSADPVAFNDELIISTIYEVGYEKDSLTVNEEVFTSGETFTVDGDVTVVATGKLSEYTLTISDTSATTTITKDGSPIITEATIYYGDELVISAIPVDPATIVAITVNDVAFTSGETHSVVGNTTVVSVGS